MDGELHHTRWGVTAHWMGQINAGTAAGRSRTIFSLSNIMFIFLNFFIICTTLIEVIFSLCMMTFHQSLTVVICCVKSCHSNLILTWMKRKLPPTVRFRCIKAFGIWEYFIKALLFSYFIFLCLKNNCSDVAEFEFYSFKKAEFSEVPSF